MFFVRPGQWIADMGTITLRSRIIRETAQRYGYDVSQFTDEELSNAVDSARVEFPSFSELGLDAANRVLLERFLMAIPPSSRTS